MIRIKFSPLSGLIYAVNRSGKRDVTGEACAAVVRRVVQEGPQIVSCNGVPVYEIIVKEIPNAGTNEHK